MQMLQYMQSEKSMSNWSRTFWLRSRPPSEAGGMASLCESIVMHQAGHSRAHNMHDVQFSSCSAMTPRLRGGSSGSTSG